VLKNKIWKILYFDAVKDKFGPFMIGADRFYGNSCKSMGICIIFSLQIPLFSELTHTFLTLKVMCLF
jgi:hypothetical protein